MSSSRETKDLIGHTKQWQEFVDSFNTGKLHHAWLLVGERGIGKATFAYKATKFLMNNGDIKTPHSSTYKDIEKKVENLSHPDLYILDTESNTDSKASSEIKVDVVRALQNFIMLTPALSKYKVVIIDDINIVNLNAANALLKFLEEPTSHTIFFIVCHTQGTVLPTIRSRCRTLKFNHLTFEDFKQTYLSYCPDADINNAQELFDISCGSLSYAQMFNSKPAMFIYNKVEHMLAKGYTNQDVLELTQLANDDESWEIFQYSIRANLLKTIKDQSSEKDEHNIKGKISYYERVDRILRDAKRFHLEKSSVVCSIF